MVNGVAILILLRNKKSTCSAVIPLARASLTLVLDRLPTAIVGNLRERRVNIYDWCFMPNEHDDDICFVSDRHTELDFNSARYLK